MYRILFSVVLLCLVISAQQPVNQFMVIYEWKSVNFTWPSDAEYENAIKAAKYIPENNHISGIKYFEGYLYLTVPRTKDGVPATLVRIPYNKDSHAPLLEPYPSWKMNEEDNCEAIQNVQNVEIDRKGYMWILDGGRTRTLSKVPNSRCPARLIIYDIKSNRIVVTYTFPTEMTNNGSFLYDLVVDDVDGGYAYITDNSGSDPGIIVYSLKENQAWIVRDAFSMKASPDAQFFTVNGTGVSAEINIAGIAMGPKVVSHGDHDIVTQDRVVYYCPLSSYRLFSVQASTLRNKQLTNVQIGRFVKEIGRKASQTDGMVMDDHGVLYYGLLGDNSIARWDSRMPFTNSQTIITRSKDYLQWPDSLAFDDDGNLLIVTNRLQKHVYGSLNTSEPNFRILRGHVGGKSYLYSTLINDNNYNTTNTEFYETTQASFQSSANIANNNLFYTIVFVLIIFVSNH